MTVKAYATTGLEPFEAHRLCAVLHLVSGLEQSGGATVAFSTAMPMNRQSGFLVALGDPMTETLPATIDSDELVIRVNDFAQLWWEAADSQYLGIWREPVSRQIWLDVCSFHCNEIAARNAADRNGQLCFWDIRNNCERFASLGLAAL